jgi:hypothetical protein
MYTSQQLVTSRLLVTPLKSAAWLLTPTETSPSGMLGTWHRTTVDDSQVADTRSSPKRQASSALGMKLSPITCTTVPLLWALLGTTFSTRADGPYVNASSVDPSSPLADVTSTRTVPGDPALGAAHCTIDDDSTVAADVLLPNRHVSCSSLNASPVNCTLHPSTEH